MFKYDTGSLIKRLRRQKDMTQEQLAEYAGIDRATLSKIENGKATANASTLLVVFQKLGMEAAGISGYFLSRSESEWEARRKELEAAVSYREYEKAYTITEALENDAEFMKRAINRQYVKNIRGHIHLYSGKSPEEALEMLDEAIKMTIPYFNIKYLHEYHLTVVEINICSNMATGYGILQRYDEAVALMAALKENFENNCIDRNLFGKQYPAVIYYLTRFLFFTKKYEEAIGLCDAGIKAAVTSGYSGLVPQIALNKAVSLCLLGKKEEGGELFRNAYYAYLLYGMDDNAEMVKKDAKKYADFEL